MRILGLCIILYLMVGTCTAMDFNDTQWNLNAETIFSGGTFNDSRWNLEVVFFSIGSQLNDSTLSLGINYEFNATVRTTSTIPTTTTTTTTTTTLPVTTTIPKCFTENSTIELENFGFQVWDILGCKLMDLRDDWDDIIPISIAMLLSLMGVSIVILMGIAIHLWR